MPKIAVSDEEVKACFEVMQELRPHLVKENFLGAIREMEKQGYRLVYIEESSFVVALAGYRISTNLFMGKNLYVDDLVTSKNQRSKGHGESLISWLKQLAIESGCNKLHLDSGTHRDQAHKFYFSQGLVIASYHFSKDIA